MAERIELRPLPPAEAIQFFRDKGYAIGFDWPDVWQQEHARAFTVAKVASVDLLEDIRQAVDAAIAEGTTLREFQSRLEPILRAKGWWGRQHQIDPVTGEEREVQLGSPRRLQTIYDTNLRAAHSAGRWARIQRVKAARPYLRYSAVLDSRTRPEHRAWHGTVLPVDHPFWDSHHPPNGWRCRCTVTQLGPRDLERRGYQVSEEAPETGTRRWTNRRTGETLEVPKGIDPGFSYNVGKAAARRPAGTAFDLMAEKMEGWRPDTARAAVRDLTASDLFRRHLSGELRGAAPVAMLPDDLASALQVQRQVIRVSQETALKQARHHGDVTAADYGRLEVMLERGEILKDGQRHLSIQHADPEDGRWWRAVVKRTEDGKELYLLSLHRIMLRHRRRALARGELVRKRTRRD